MYVYMEQSFAKGCTYAEDESYKLTGKSLQTCHTWQELFNWSNKFEDHNSTSKLSKQKFVRLLDQNWSTGNTHTSISCTADQLNQKYKIRDANNSGIQHVDKLNKSSKLVISGRPDRVL